MGKRFDRRTPGRPRTLTLNDLRTHDGKWRVALQRAPSGTRPPRTHLMRSVVYSVYGIVPLCGQVIDPETTYHTDDLSEVDCGTCNRSIRKLKGTE